MAEDRNKKKRVARIGNMGTVQGTSKLHCDDGLAQADCNLVYDIMQSMNKSKKVMSYQELQDFRLKENASRTNNSEQNGKSLISKQVKKFVPERTFPLMAKCQKSMKYLKKNRCIPKPRAHVGFIPRPPQKPNFSIGYHNHSVSNKIRNRDELPLKLKKKSKKSRHSPETNVKVKRRKISQSSEDSNERSFLHTKSPGKDALISNVDTDSDNEFEYFIQKHQPEKCASSKNSNSVHRKLKKRKRKKHNKFVFIKETGKISQRPLSDSEESSETECRETNLKKANMASFSIQQFPSRSFQKIVSSKNSDDSESDAIGIDSGALNNDSSEDENILNAESSDIKSLDQVHKDDSKVFDNHTTLVNSITSSSSLSELKNTIGYDLLKLKCKIPCSVVLERDPLIDQKAVLLYTENLSINRVPFSSVDDEDDCIIISETSTDNINGISENRRQSSESNFSPTESTTISKPSSNFEVSVDKNGLQNNKTVFNSDGFKLQIEANAMPPSKVPFGISNGTEETSMEVHKEKSLISKQDNEEKSLSIVSGTLCDSSGLHNFEDGSLSVAAATSDAEKDTFRVQILSVKSLGESNIIDLSDDGEEKDLSDDDSKAVSVVNETNRDEANDSDVEIICLDSSIVNEKKSVKENAVDISNNEMLNEVTCNQNSLNEEDCIILDDVEVSSESGKVKYAGEVQQSSQANGKAVVIDETQTNANKKETILDNVSTNSILKILDTIDFNSIKKVLSETTVSGIQEDKKSESLPVKTENSFCKDTNVSNKTESLSEKPMQNQTAVYISQQQTAKNEIVAPIGSTKINYNLKGSEIVSEENKNLKNTTILSKVKNESTNVPNPVKSRGIASNRGWDENTTKLSVSEKIKACNLKTDPNTQIIRQLPTKQESVSDELDILVSKSIQSIDEKQMENIMPLLNLYEMEYRKFMQIKCTEENVAAGLKLLEENQAKKLMRISSSIKNLAKNDLCFHKVKNEFHEVKDGDDKISLKSSLIKKDEVKKPLEFVTQPSTSNRADIEEENVKIFHPSVVERATEVLKSQSVGPSSSHEVYNHLINSICAECGRHAMAACLGCAKVFYCSEKCGMSYWNKGHYATCRR